MNTRTRLDPSRLRGPEQDFVQKVSRLGSSNGIPALMAPDGSRIELPKSVFGVLLDVVKNLQQGNSVLIMHDEETLTTQAAAGILGVSRPHLVKLLETHQINFHRVGSHRRIFPKDLQDYQKRKNAERRSALDSISDETPDELYDAVPNQPRE